VLVVLAATLYYFAYVRGKSSLDLGSLSALDQIQAEGESDTSSGSTSGAQTQYRTVSVAQFPLAMKDAAFEVCDFLEAKGHNDVHVIQVKSELCVCVGRVANKKQLEGTLAEIKGLLYRGHRDFSGAKITTISLKPAPN
jgi:hypothetical protein